MTIRLCGGDERQIGHRRCQQKLEESLGSSNIPRLTHPQLAEPGNAVLNCLPESVEVFKAG